MAKVRTLKMEPRQTNPLMRLPIHTSFIARFLVQPVCYTRSATFAGMLQIYNLQYSCTLAEGFLNGEEIMRDDFSDQHRFSIPITPVDNLVRKMKDLNEDVGFRIPLSQHVMNSCHLQFIIEDLIKKNSLHKMHLH